MPDRKILIRMVAAAIIAALAVIGVALEIPQSLLDSLAGQNTETSEVAPQAPAQDSRYQAAI